MKPADVNPSIYNDSNKEINKEGPKFKVGNHVRISKYKNIFRKVYGSDWSQEVFLIKKVKKIVPWTYAISDLNGEEIAETFFERKN